MKALSILIPSRNEMFLERTIEDILENIEADTEVITVLDGNWTKHPISQNEREYHKTFKKHRSKSSNQHCL